MTSRVQESLQTAEKKKSKYNKTDERSGGLIDSAKLGHIAVRKTKALQDMCKEG